MLAKTAVIVSNHNGKQFLKNCFDHVFRQTYTDFKVYLLDIASSDGSIEYVRQAFPAVKILARKTNCGFAQGYNQAISEVDAEYIAILNGDTKTSPCWLAELVKAAEENPDAALIGSKIYFLNQPGVINCCGKKLTLSGTGFDIGYGSRNSFDFNEPKEVGALCGASMLVKKNVFLELGGFDGDYFLLCEDTDLCWRAWLAGYRVIYQPNSIVEHEFGQAIGKRETPLRIFHTQRNALITVFKNFAAAKLIFALAVIAFYTALRTLLYLFTGQSKNLKALLEATGSIFPLLGPTWAKRRGIQSKRKISDSFLVQKGLLASLKESIREYCRVSRL